MEDIKALSDQIRQIAYNIHAYHGMDIWRKSMRTRWRTDCGRPVLRSSNSIRSKSRTRMAQ